jgi:hypothetical protein
MVDVAASTREIQPRQYVVSVTEALPLSQDRKSGSDLPRNRYPAQTTRAFDFAVSRMPGIFYPATRSRLCTPLPI